MSKTGTLADREEILCKHLPYEIEMLRFAHRMLQEPHRSDLIGNSLIECFCIHARNLIDFFYDDKRDNSRDAMARHFTDRSSYCPFAGKSPKQPGGLYSKLNKQITHITYDRTDIDGEKIGHKDRHDLRHLIEMEINNFRNHMREPYKKYADRYHGDFSNNPWPLSLNATTNTTNNTSSSVTIIGGYFASGARSENLP